MPLVGDPPRLRIPDRRRCAHNSDCTSHQTAVQITHAVIITSMEQLVSLPEKANNPHGLQLPRAGNRQRAGGRFGSDRCCATPCGWCVDCTAGKRKRSSAGHMRLADSTRPYLYRGRGSGQQRRTRCGGRCRRVKIPVGIALASVRWVSASRYEDAGELACTRPASACLLPQDTAHRRCAIPVVRGVTHACFANKYISHGTMRDLLGVSEGVLILSRRRFAWLRASLVICVNGPVPECSDPAKLQARLRRMGALACVWTLETRHASPPAGATTPKVLLQAKCETWSGAQNCHVFFWPPYRSSGHYSSNLVWDHRRFAGRSL